ncbi:hypothetical protein [Tautonia sociabilis]|uniref:Uncharacterized protein n=1 Tax=Tautonia sociabilis TaxID=2080755 RepID=A0A432MKD0_9BACT|nr:hypothetical protein [Tautonia sociabilis]RUL87874.1 hypothetical protein TsocGM_10095 [Tautonia sociabilis]
MTSESDHGPGCEGQIVRDALERAIAIYLELAYPETPLPEAVRRRLAWREVPGPVPLDSPPFEPSASGPDRSMTYALRLGNARYPHMKLQVQPWPSPAGFLLSVNTHDQVAVFDPSAPEAEAVRALQAVNQRFKQEIESAWEHAGLPTFLAYLKDYIQREEGSSTGS